MSEGLSSGQHSSSSVNVYLWTRRSKAGRLCAEAVTCPLRRDGCLDKGAVMNSREK